MGKDGKYVFLKDIWPTQAEVAAVMRHATDPATYRKLYSDFTKDNPLWNGIPSSTGMVYGWEKSTYIAEPPFFNDFSLQTGKIGDVKNARALALFGDSVTTDHISPAGSIKRTSPAGKYLLENGVKEIDFNSYGSRRGNHEVMMRGTFANVRIKNLMLPGTEGGITLHQPDGEQMSIYDAAMKYIAAGTPTVVFAGEEYGTGSSRDWAAKGTRLLGVKAVVAKSFERIHRSNLIGMGVLALQFKGNDSLQSLNLKGNEQFDILGVNDGIKPQQDVTLVVRRPDGSTQQLSLLLRIDTPVEVEYYKHGGILPYVLREIVQKSA
jgi:aconitate hydratase